MCLRALVRLHLYSEICVWVYMWRRARAFMSCVALMPIAFVMVCRCKYAWANVCAYVFEGVRTPGSVFGGMRVSVRAEACACVHASVWH